MVQKKELSIILLLAVIYTILFHNNPLGLNLLIFEFLVVIGLLLLRKPLFKSPALITATSGLLITGFAVVYAFSAWAIFINILVFFVFIGCLAFPQIKSFFHAIPLFFHSAFQSPFMFFKKLGETRLKGRNIGVYLKRIRLFLIPLLIVIVFIIIYRNSNPVFNELVKKIGVYINDVLVFIFGRFDAAVILTFFLGLFFCMVIFIHTPHYKLVEGYIKKSDIFMRIRKRLRRRFLLTALKNEYRAGVFLFLSLNVVLLIVNIIDIKWVWFTFEWSGDYLKQFVHQGTYLLILSIIISVVLVLYFFRGNISFYKNNKFLKYLSYAWLLQNAVLAISVGIRNYWYIYYFSLAYKRIAVFMFLLLTIYGLYTVYVKVRSNKSTFYLIRRNALSLFIVLVISTVFNWDIIIARYNFAHAERSFVHFNFLSSLSPKALPYLEKPVDELMQIENNQKQVFPYRFRYMTAHEYFSKIKNKKKNFKAKWESKGVLSWNYPEYKAYKALFEEGK